MSSPAAIASLLKAMPNVEQLSPRVLRILGQNPSSFTLNGSCTYLVGLGRERVLIDTGGGVRSWMELLQNDVLQKDSSAPLTISTVLLTHSHVDHVGGLPHVRELFPSAVVYKLPSPFRPQADAAIDGLQTLKGNETFVIDRTNSRDTSTTLNVLATPGHCDDHACFQLLEENALFTGDTILGIGTTVFMCYHDYMSSLAKLKALNPGRLYPGHGPVVEGGEAKISEYIAHRQQREDQVVQCMIEHCPSFSGNGMQPMDIVEKVYVDTPQHLHFAAALNVCHHLRKLHHEGLVSPVFSVGTGSDTEEEEQKEVIKRLLSAPEYTMDKGAESSPEREYVQQIISIRWRWEGTPLAPAADELAAGRQQKDQSPKL